MKKLPPKYAFKKVFKKVFKNASRVCRCLEVDIFFLFLKTRAKTRVRHELKPYAEF